MKKIIKLLLVACVIVITAPSTSFSEETIDQSALERARLSDIEAQYNLGLRYYEGRGNVPRNYVEAHRWYMKAAKRGHAKAQYNLGITYDKGRGVE